MGNRLPLRARTPSSSGSTLPLLRLVRLQISTSKGRPGQEGAQASTSRAGAEGEAAVEAEAGLARLSQDLSFSQGVAGLGSPRMPDSRRRRTAGRCSRRTAARNLSMTGSRRPGGQALHKSPENPRGRLASLSSGDRRMLGAPGRRLSNRRLCLWLMAPSHSMAPGSEARSSLSGGRVSSRVSSSRQRGLHRKGRQQGLCRSSLLSQHSPRPSRRSSGPGSSRHACLSGTSGWMRTMCPQSCQPHDRMLVTRNAARCVVLQQPAALPVQPAWLSALGAAGSACAYLCSRLHAGCPCMGSC